MYHDFLGREIEDAEMDNMRRLPPAIVHFAFRLADDPESNTDDYYTWGEANIPDFQKKVMDMLLEEGFDKIVFEKDSYRVIVTRAGEE